MQIRKTHDLRKSPVMMAMNKDNKGDLLVKNEEPIPKKNAGKHEDLIDGFPRDKT